MAAPFKKRKILRLSGSRMRTFRACPAKFAMQHFLYRSGDESDFSGFAADVGTALHHAWQSYIRNKDLEMAQAVLAVRWPWHHPFMDDKRPFWRGQDALVDLCNETYSNYEVMRVQKSDGSVRDAIELALQLVVHTEYFEIHYTGYVDAVVMDPGSGMPIILDAKTTSMREDLFDPSYRFDNQLAGYAIILNALVQGGSMDGSIKGAYLGVGTTRSAQWCSPCTKIYNKRDALEFIHELHMTAAQISMFQNAGRFPRNPGNCMAYFTPCHQMDRLCPITSLADQQYKVQPVIMQDLEYQEFTPEFSVTFQPEMLK